MLTVDLGELQLLTHNRNDVAPEVVLDHMITSYGQLANDDDFINNVIDEDDTLEDYVDKEFGEDDSENNKESTGDEQLEYYSETNDHWIYYIIVFFLYLLIALLYLSTYIFKIMINYLIID